MSPITKIVVIYLPTITNIMSATTTARKDFPLLAVKRAWSSLHSYDDIWPIWNHINQCIADIHTLSVDGITIEFWRQK